MLHRAARHECLLLYAGIKSSIVLPCWKRSMKLVAGGRARLLSLCLCAGTGLRQACHVLQGILVLPLLGLSDPFSFQVDRREHHS